MEKQAEQVMDATIAALETPCPLGQTAREHAGAMKAAIDTVLVRSFFRALARDPHELAHLDEAAAE